MYTTKPSIDSNPRREVVWIALLLLACACNDPAPTGSEPVDGNGAPFLAADAGSGAGADADPAEDAGADGPSGDAGDADDERDGDPDDLGDVDAGGGDLFAGPSCVAEAPPAARYVAGLNPDGTILAPGGRELLPAGTHVRVEGFPTQVVLHPALPLAYVASASDDDRRLVVVDYERAEVVQDIDRGEAHYGLALDASAGVLWASGGDAERVERYTIGEDGLLTLAAQIDVGVYPAGLALSPDGARLWVADFGTSSIVEVDIEAGEVARTFFAASPGWALASLPERGELWATTLQGDAVSVLDTASGELLATIEVGPGPAGMVRDDDGNVWVAVSDADRVVVVDPESRAVLRSHGVQVQRDEGSEDAALPEAHANPNALAFDAERGRVYVSRGGDNAVSVLAAADGEVLGELPSAWYPTDVALSPDGATLIVAEGKGFGSGPSQGQGSKELLTGGVTVVDLDAIDLSATSEAAAAQLHRPTRAFPFDCPTPFPVPTRPEHRSPIEHVILIVKENKTFDCVFGDLDPTEMDVDVDPTLVRWGEEITPNQHALARAFAFSDNFYTEVENSDMGHILLTALHLTEFIERIWAEKARTGRYQGFQVSEWATPEVGNFFTHLMEHDVDLRIYGEIVGLFASTDDGEQPLRFSDARFPGGPAVNYSVTDERKASYVAERIAAGELATFTYLLLPNDHTVGTRPGEPTPESMVADNDYAVGIVVDAVARSPFWESTAIFIVEDDPQGCQDHVDSHRSFVTIVSPWARRGYVSHAHYSLVSVFATIQRILAVPPLGRSDGSASPMWDMFTDRPDFTPWERIERTWPRDFNAADAPGAEASLAMDFRGPDRNPELFVVLDAYRLWRMGRIDRAEAERRIADLEMDDERREELEEEAEEEGFAFDHAWEQYEAWLQAQGLPVPELPLGPVGPTRADDDE